MLLVQHEKKKNSKKFKFIYAQSNLYQCRLAYIPIYSDCHTFKDIFLGLDVEPR